MPPKRLQEYLIADNTTMKKIYGTINNISPDNIDIAINVLNDIIISDANSINEIATFNKKK